MSKPPGKKAKVGAADREMKLKAIATILDGYGFGMERLKVNAADNTECTSTTEICRWRVLFGGWGRGDLVMAYVNGAASTDVTPCQWDTVTVTATVVGGLAGANASGAIQ